MALLTPCHQCWALWVCPTRASSGCPAPGPAQMTPDWLAQCGLSGHRPRPVPTLSSLTHVVCLGSQIRCGAETSGPGSWVAPSLPVTRTTELEGRHLPVHLGGNGHPSNKGDGSGGLRSQPWPTAESRQGDLLSSSVCPEETGHTGAAAHSQGTGSAHSSWKPLSWPETPAHACLPGAGPLPASFSRAAWPPAKGPAPLPLC